MRAGFFFLCALLGCGGGPGTAAPIDAGTLRDAGAPSIDAGAPPDAGITADGGAPDCPPTLLCVASFPHHDERDTTFATQRALSGYSCAPMTNEGGPEFVYRFTLTRPGLFGARVADGAFTDIDIHLLSALDPAACIARNDLELSRYLEPGTYYVVADTWVDLSGVERLGAYALDLTFVEVPEIACDMRVEPLPRRTGDTLQLPATGPVVLEAHLVTTAEDFDGGWPTSFTDGIARHYSLSEAASGYLMRRDQPWAPAGEGGSMFGQGSTSRPPLEHEAWYVNMYWQERPARGTRMIIRQPDGGLAVVAAAGYETGPGSATAIGGATEEIHDYLGTVHRSTLTMGFAVDQGLPVGPARCTP